MIKLTKPSTLNIKIIIVLIYTLFLFIAGLKNKSDIPAFSKKYKPVINGIYLNFSDKQISEYEIILSGISGWETWGRWIDGNKALIEMPIIMSGNINYKVKFTCLSSKKQQGMNLYFGHVNDYILIGECDGKYKIIEKKIFIDKFSDIKIIPNYYVNVPGDPRNLSIGLISIELKNDL